MEQLGPADIQKDDANLRTFGILMAVLLPLFGFLLIPLIFGTDKHFFTLYLSVSFFLISLAYPKGLVFVYVPWMVLGGYLGRINSYILLSLIFYLLITPLALLFKLLGKDPLERKIKKNMKTYFIKSDSEDPVSRMRFPF